MSAFESKAENRWRELLDSRVNPAVLARVCRWGRPHSDDISTEILRLAHKGVIRVHCGQRTNAAGTQLWDWRLSRQPKSETGNVGNGAGSALDPIDVITLKMLFDVVAGGADELWLGEFHRYARAQAGNLRMAVTSWQAELTDEITRQNAFSSISVKLGKALPFVAGASALLGFFITLGTGSPVYVVCFAVLAIALALASRQMPQLSPHAAEKYEAARQLRTWLRDLPKQGRGARIPDDQEFWNALMPLAYMLGEARSAMTVLRLAVPEAIDAANQQVDCAEDADGGLREVAWPEWYAEPSTTLRPGEGALPRLAAYLPICIHGAAFAANATVANEMAFAQMLTALNNPVTVVGTIGGIPGVLGTNYDLPSAAELFVRHVKRPSESSKVAMVDPTDLVGAVKDLG